MPEDTISGLLDEIGRLVGKAYNLAREQEQEGQSAIDELAQVLQDSYLEMPYAATNARDMTYWRERARSILAAGYRKSG